MEEPPLGARAPGAGYQGTASQGSARSRERPIATSAVGVHSVDDGLVHLCGKARVIRHRKVVRWVLLDGWSGIYRSMVKRAVTHQRKTWKLYQCKGGASEESEDPRRDLEVSDTSYSLDI